MTVGPGSHQGIQAKAASPSTGTPKTHHLSALLCVHLHFTSGHKTSLLVKSKHKIQPGQLFYCGESGGCFCCSH